ncbi:MAG TPA: branched-chain amino acid ABC transporter permease [Gaiellaceae bacterium]
MSRPGTVRAGAVVGVAAAIALLPLTLSGYHRSTGAAVAVYFVAIVAFQVVAGYTGQISVGHGAFMAVGGYTTAILTHDHGWNDLATLPVAAAAGLAAGIVVGLPALRLRGVYLALTTFAAALAVPQVAKNYSGLTGGSEGLSLPSHSGLWLYEVAWAVAGATLVIAWLLLRGRTGRAFRAIRDSEVAAAVSGVSPAFHKTAAFAVSAAMAAVAGSLFVLVNTFVSPDVFGLQLSLYVLIGAVVSGLGSLSGVLAGAVFVELLPVGLTTSGLTSSQAVPVVFGAVVIAVAALLPRGAAEPLRSLLRLGAPRSQHHADP